MLTFVRSKIRLISVIELHSTLSVSDWGRTCWTLLVMLVMLIVLMVLIVERRSIWIVVGALVCVVCGRSLNGRRVAL